MRLICKVKQRCKLNGNKERKKKKKRADIIRFELLCSILPRKASGEVVCFNFLDKSKDAIISSIYPGWPNLQTVEVQSG